MDFRRILMAAATQAGGSPYLPEANALFARMTTPPDDTRKGLINTCIGSLISAGVWAKLDCLYLTAAADSQAARLNWISSSYTLSAVSSPTFTTDRGYTGDGVASYLDSGYAPGSSAGVAAQDSNHMGVWCNTNVSGAGFDYAATAQTINANSSGNTNTRNMALTTDALAGAGTSVGHTMHSRSAGASYTVYKNASSLGSPTRASTAPAAFNLYMCARNASGTASGFGTRRIAAAHSGGALNGTEVTAIYNALNTYLTAVGGA